MSSASVSASWQRTKIVCTLGPATDKAGVLEELVLSGMDVARINMSHGTHADHAARIGHVRAVSDALSRPIAVLADLPGPKFRIGALEGGSRNLDDGAIVFLMREAQGPESLPVRHRELLQALHSGESVYLADGSIELRVQSVSADRVACEVIVGGTVRSGSGINVPDSDLPGLVPTDDDQRHLAFAVAQEVDWIGVSFVQSADDLGRVRACIPEGHAPLLMAKIEKRRALLNLDSIIDAADGVMVARGDLGVETDLAEIPLAQKRIIAAANAKARPVVTATQMLESMVEHEHPTRAEVTDVANAVLDGTDAVMLSAESAVGRYAAAAVKMLQRVITATEAEYARRMSAARLDANGSGQQEQPVSAVACQLAERVGAKAIITLVDDQRMAAAIARFRPAAPIVALTSSHPLCRSLAMMWGVSPIETGENDDERAHARRTQAWLFAHGLARSGDRAIMISASSESGRTPDTLRVITLNE
jgi:pyruvate kinase